MPSKTLAPPASTMTFPSDTEILIERSFAAPRELVWRAFTDPTLLPKWNGLPAFPMTVCEMDLRPNGRFRWSFAGEGVAFTTEGVIREADPPRRLVMESMDPDPTPEVRTITFEESGGRTTVVIRIKTATKEIRDALLASGAIEGMEVTWPRLDALLADHHNQKVMIDAGLWAHMRPDTVAPNTSSLTLPSDTEIEIVRSFAAPRELVWRVWTDAKLLPRWMGFPGSKMTHSEMDVRTGGGYRWTWDVPPSGMTIHGKFLEVDAPRKLVADEYTEYTKPFPAPSRNTITFTEKDRRTTVSVRIKLATREARDAVLATGAKDGMDVSYARLDSLLAELS